MKRVVCVCNTYYQLIFLIQLKRTIYKNDNVIAIVSDHSQNHVCIAKNLRRCMCFEDVYVVDTKQFDISVSNPITAKKEAEKLFRNLKGCKVDEFLFYNRSKSTTLLWNILFKTNPKIRRIKIEEGILSYNNIDHKYDNIDYKSIPVTNSRLDRLLYYFRKMIPSLNLIDKITDFYCFYPSVYTGTLNPCPIPLIDKNKVGNVIVETFGVNKCELVYKEKYIFFTSVYDFEGGEAIGELELVRAIAEKVGKENLLVKMHPRDTRTVYADEGFHIDTNSSIPFEALLFAYDFSENVLLTATSGAVLSASLMHDNPPKTYYMYPLCKIDGNQAAKNTVEQINRVLCSESIKDSLMQIRVCECIDEIIVEESV